MVYYLFYYLFYFIVYLFILLFCLFFLIGNFTCTAILGNPGIGKSFFHFYFLKFLLGKNNTVVYHHNLMTHWYLFTPTGVRQGDNDTPLPNDLNDLSTWYLVDAIKPKIWAAKTVLVFSPNPATYREFVKEGARTRYMPVWTEAEILHCREGNG
jgi:hypothetical protein